MLSGRRYQKGIYSSSDMNSTPRIDHELWPLGEIDPEKAKFPCCLVWTPLPVVSWLAPFVGHMGICREDGVIMDFSGSYLINEDDLAFGATARYVQLDRNQCCFPTNMADHTCNQGYLHAQYGTCFSWDEALVLSMRHFQSKTHNLFRCNCHSFVAHSLNRLCYGGSKDWNMINVACLLLFKGRWVSWKSIVRSFLPFAVVFSIGILLVGWPFILGLISFYFLLVGWFLLGSYCIKKLLDSSTP